MTILRCPRCRGTGRVLSPSMVRVVLGFTVRGSDECPTCEGAGEFEILGPEDEEGKTHATN